MPELDFISLQGGTCSLVFDCRNNSPVLAYFGKKITSEPASLATLSRQQELPAGACPEPHISLCPTHGEGFTGQLGLKAHRRGLHWDTYPALVAIEQEKNSSVVFETEDKKYGIKIAHYFEIDESSDVISMFSQIMNTNSEELTVDWFAAPTMVVSEQFSDIISVEGRWAKEFQLRRFKRVAGTYLRENRKGRTSHDSFPGLLIAGNNTNDTSGEAISFHLGWSGNHRLCCEELHDGRALVQLGELLFPGEIILQSGESYTSPKLFVSYSDMGFSKIAEKNHSFVRNKLLRQHIHAKARPVHFNTWEAVYFDHQPDSIKSLASEAAAVGAERFILDDGWFKSRNNDHAGLGDWFVDESVYPDGLTPIIDHVHSLGMEFGLWLEPEMVNPDSDLYRKRPDWVLNANGSPQVMARNQLVLDLTRDDVVKFLYECIDKLLTQYDIQYIKWDMNRDVHQPVNNLGRAGIHKQTQSLYTLIDNIRQAHPKLEIESCASGGGRADYGILRYTDRIWTSDSNDAIDRLSIQKGFSLFFPPEVMGSHVGPSQCHITGRKLNMNLRASTALFGHMGIEVDIRQLEREEKSILKSAVLLYKRFRSLIHRGRLLRFPTNDHADSFAIFSSDNKLALFSYVDIYGHQRAYPGYYFFRGLHRLSKYRVSLIWPQAPLSSTLGFLNDSLKEDYTGELLETVGVQLPLIKPQSSLIFFVEEI